MPRYLVLAAAVLLSFSGTAAAAEETFKEFTAQKTYAEDLYVLNDFLEFSVFDMSKLGLFVNSEKVELRPEQTPSPEAVPGGAATEAGVHEVAPRKEGRAEKEIRAILAEIPKFFYKNLKNQISKNKVPVTLYAKDTPAYANPIQLYVKLKRISLSPTYVDKKGNTVQPVSVKIYGQLKAKKNDKLLTRFYDTEATEFVVGGAEAAKALDAIADKMMRDLALYIKTKY